MEKDFSQLAAEEQINRAKEALQKNGITVEILSNGEDAKSRVLQIIPDGAEVMNMTSVTLDAIGLSKEILESGKYDAVRNKFAKMDKNSQALEMQKLGAAPEWAIGSVHAVTEDGKVFIASATGSQLPAYDYGSSHVIWVVGAQKIVRDLEEARTRIEDYVLPLEDERAMKAYGQHSSINKMLRVEKEVNPGRITMLIIREKLGF